MTELTKKTEEFQREELGKLLQQLSTQQLELFHKIYPDGVPSAKLDSAYALCQRTIEKNKLKEEGNEPK